MTAPFITTKLYTPPLRPDGVRRGRLTGKLMAVLSNPGSFALVSGPAGFGKTTQLSEFTAVLNQPVAWVSLDEGDDEPIRFWSYLIAACQSVQPGVGEAALALFRVPMPLPAEAVPAILINDLASLNRDLVLILDDYHSIQSEAVNTAFTFLLEHIPANLHILVSTRVDPPWPLARFRARNQLVEVRAQDLRFTAEETAAFLNRMMGLNLAPADVAALEERTEGWIAGLQLAALSMKGRSDTAAFVKALTGSHVYIAEYLVEEVLLQQPPEVQAFLLHTSLLERLTAGLCEAVSACENGQQVLAGLHRANLFVLSLDDEGRWFRYHHLFADLLQARLRQTLPPEAIAALHQRAAAWYEQAGMPSEAIEHALAARDYIHAVRVIEKVALPMILQAYVRPVERWLQAIPLNYLESSPKVNMAFAWMNLLRGTFPQAEPYLQRLEKLFSSPDPALQDPSLQGEWLALQSEVLNRQGKPAESLEVANQALQILPESDTHVRSMVHVNLATAYQHMLDYDHAAGAFELMVRDARAAGDHITETMGISGQAQMLLQMGQLHRAFEIAYGGIQRLEDTGKFTPFGATLYGEVGQINYYWHRLDQAQKFLHHSIQSSGQSGYSDPEIYHHLMHSRMYQMEADWDTAAREMQKALDLARQIPPAMIREEVISQQVRIDLAFGRLADAQAVLKPDGFTFDGSLVFPPLSPGAPVTHPAGLLYNSTLRILLWQARAKQLQAGLARGVELASLVLAGELQCKHIPIALETLLLRSQLLAEMGDERSSLADVAQALALAEPEEFISSFVEEGAPIAGAISTLLKRSLIGTIRPGYIQAVLSAFRTPRTAQPSRAAPASQPGAFDEELELVEPLTGRELEVLGLLAEGDTNSTIAGKLFITVSAVKKHTSNIYGKLNVDNRTQAVARAHQLKLLSPYE